VRGGPTLPPPPFVIAYELDTQDKPYSVLGNSWVAGTPRHPLVVLSS